MKQVTAAIAILALAACGGEHRDGSVGGVPANSAELIVEAKNFDPVDYALWLEWQDDRGSWNQEFLFSVFGDPDVGPTQDFGDRIVFPGRTYSILLADPSGYLYDAHTLWLTEGTLVDLHFHIVGGVLVWRV